MIRKFAALGTAALLGFAVLPALPAAAQALGSATLTKGGIVLPGTNDYTIRVTNSEPSALLGGRSVDTVRVLFQGEARIDALAAAKSGWAAEVVSDPAEGFNRIIYRALTDAAEIAPAAAQDFPFTTLVNAPAADSTGAFNVGLSSDGGLKYTSATGTLTTKVETLQIEKVIPADPTGVTDGSGTAGQGVAFDVTVKNLASAAQNVTPKLASSGSDKVTNPAGATDVPSGESRTVRIPVELAGGGGDRAATFTGSATAPGSDTESIYNASTAFQVQAPSSLTLDATKFTPTNVKNLLTYNFAIEATKVGTPGLNVTKGELTFVNRADRSKVTAPLALKAPVTFGFPTAADSTKKTLTYDATPMNYFDPTKFADGKYDAVFTFEATDVNGYTLPAGGLTRTVSDILNLDNLGPKVNLNPLGLKADRDGQATTRARNFVAAENNSITISGTFEDSGATFEKIGLYVVETGQEIPCEGATFSGSSFSCTAKPVFENRTVTGADGQPKLATPATVRAEVSLKDLAENVGTAVSTSVAIDLQKPTIQGLLGAVVFDTRYDSKPVVRVNVKDDFGGIIGGCNPAQYAVDGQPLVLRVLYSNGDECTVGVNAARQAGPADNARILVLTQNISRNNDGTNKTATPSITYTAFGTQNPKPATTDDLKDASGQYVGNEIQDTIQQLVPEAPAIVSVTRAALKGGREAAYNDSGIYYTRTTAAGSEVLVTVSGALKNDKFQIVDGAGKAVTTTVTNDNGQATLAVPMASGTEVEGKTQKFVLRFVSVSNVTGKPTDLSVVLDTIAPKAASTKRTTGTTDKVDVTFVEPVIGINSASNVVSWENVGTRKEFRQVNEVTGAGTTRTLTVEFSSPTANYGGSRYQYSAGQEYQDFAGNLLLSPTSVSVATAS